MHMPSGCLATDLQPEAELVLCCARLVLPDAERALVRHDWPGNVRELLNTVERIMILEDGVSITPGNLPPEILRRSGNGKRSLVPNPADLDLHVIADNYATHKHPRVKSWLKRHPRFHMHFIPTSSSWLNLIERWFREITDKRLRRGTFRSVEQLIEAITALIKEHNDNPQSFAWTAKAEDILAKVRKLNDIAADRGQSLAQMAIAWTLRDPRVTSSLIGAAVSKSTFFGSFTSTAAGMLRSSA